MKQRVAIVLLTIGLGCDCWGQVAALPTTGKDTLSRNPYPYELPGLKFYVKHLARLRPYDSDRALVVHVLGSGQGTELNRWRLQALYVGEGNKLAQDITRRLVSRNIKPKQRLSLSG